MKKDIILKAENISKQYRLGQVGTGTLSHDINRWWHNIRGKENPYLKIGEVNDRSTKAISDYVWALQNINFEVERGEVLGIIGKNGAGKSTLLKILSKVTAPTTGSIKYKGRIASLLEVGTGFHPEMTGRENIYLNGAILGMTKKEITSKLDQIIDFSGVERYIDTPVKRYSSGMYVRLAFAVAAHLESEILIVDEVLSVGDAEFQKKCMGKMGDISKQEGRTVLFVSHNIAAISAICNKGIYLKNGQVYSMGDIQKVISDYVSTDSEFTTYHTAFDKYKFDSSIFEPVEFGILDSNNNRIEGYVKNNDTISIQFKFILKELLEDFNFGFAIYDFNEQLLFWSFNTDVRSEERVELKIGLNSLNVQIPKNLLNEGEYFIHMTASVHYKYWIFEPNVNSPVINLKIQGGLSESNLWISKRAGILAPILHFNSSNE